MKINSTEHKQQCILYIYFILNSLTQYLQNVVNTDRAQYNSSTVQNITISSGRGVGKICRIRLTFKDIGRGHPGSYLPKLSHFSSSGRSGFT